MNDYDTTHYEGCWRSGELKHLMCAMQCMKDLLKIMPDNWDVLFDAAKKQTNVMGFKIKETDQAIVHIDYGRKIVSSLLP